MKVLITRPASQASRLAEKIRELKLEPVIFSAIQIREPRDKTILKKILDNLSEFHKIIFVSPISVEKFAEWKKSIPESIPLFAVGKSTADVIQALGYGTAIYPQNNFNSEALLEISELRNIAEQKILICKGEGGDPLLTNVLQERGAVVTHANLYQRALPETSPLPDLAEIDLIICSSGEGLNNLSQLYGTVLYQKNVMVSSMKLFNLAKKLGFTAEIYVADNASDEGILRKLQDKTIGLPLNYR